MKKATIKRRKRVIAAQDDVESVENDGSGRSAEGTPERGTMNADGSINLGFRRRAEQLPPIEPRPGFGIPGGQPSPVPTDPAAYQTSHHHNQDVPMYLNEENRLASLATVASTEERQPSLSPASFLSSNRKRSFSAATEADLPPPDSSRESTKRVSSINSILNPADTSDQIRYEHGRSPSAATTHFEGREASAEGEGMAGRREALRREAEKMRAMLAAKERELAELGIRE